MLKKRIIPCLDIKDGLAVKGVNFVDIICAGDPIELARRYMREGADELVFLDITATVEKRETLVELVRKIAAEVNIPFTVGGGIRNIESAQAAINAGADKVAINSSAVERPELISEIALEFGSQCVVVAIDAKPIGGDWKVVVHGGRRATSLNALQWARKAEKLGAGEILLTSMQNDGVKGGFALDITRQLADELGIPLIASGGAGTVQHFIDVFTQTMATGALAASIFHFGEISIPTLKNQLKRQNIPIR